MTAEETETIAWWTQEATGATAERNRLIREAHANGASLREIATATGTLTHSAIARIVKR